MVGAGFAGLSVAWHLLNVTYYLFFFFYTLLHSLQNKNNSFLSIDININNGEQSSGKDLGLHIDIYDEVGIGGGASGVSGGLLHPYSPKGTIPYHTNLLRSTTLPALFSSLFFFFLLYLFFLLFTSCNLQFAP